MIISKTIKITISNNKQYWLSKGFDNIKQGDTIEVKIEDVQPQCNKLILSKCDECGLEWEQQYQVAYKSVNFNKVHRCYSCNRKNIGKTMDKTNIIAVAKKRAGVFHQRWKPDKNEFATYKSTVRRLTEINYQLYKHIINPDNHPRTLRGYRLVYKITVIKGFKNKIAPEEIAALDNFYLAE